MRILHLDDDPMDAVFVQRAVHAQGVAATFTDATTAAEFTRALAAESFDAVIVDNGLPGYSSKEAIRQAKAASAEVPVIVCSGGGRDADVAANFAAGANDYVLKDYPSMLVAALRRHVARSATAASTPPSIPGSGMSLLVEVVQKLSLARDLQTIVDIVRVAARQLTGADGATFVLRDGEKCYYVDEDAISTLWKGQRFPLQACISGWAMLNSKSTIIPDIYKDARIPHAAYQPTFVRSLAMVPIRTSAPIGAIGNYWARHHECTQEELTLLEALANTTAVAMENVQVYQSLERKVRERTRELQLANQELEAFSSAVSHDLRAPLRHMNALIDGIADPSLPAPPQRVERLRDCTERMARLIDDLLRLSMISRAELRVDSVDLGAIATKIMQRLRTADPARSVEFTLGTIAEVRADRGLMAVVLENLLSNAWKYSSKQASGAIAFEVREEQDGRRVYCVTDNGAGFDSKLADQLFKPFSRLHAAQDFPGIGIGLATVQRIIQRHGGEIWARSEGHGRGAQFCFTLQAEQ
ncbi:MAG TPA: ATP-binding protein [Steroidobacteraceae bacterium]|nr:ATP-binding protein [Steroidobacteraceae bacterium]